MRQDYFYGSGRKALLLRKSRGGRIFFQVDRLVDIYNLVQEAPEVWEAKYRRTQYTLPVPAKGRTQKEKEKASVFRQIRLLAARCLEITVNDRKRFLLQLLMAPGLGILLYLAFSGSLEPFVLARDTETFSIALACCCFWIGLFQAIQEICKERTIMERERMAGLKMPAYFFSKAIVLGGFLILQCFLLLGCVWVLIGSPKQGLSWETPRFWNICCSPVLRHFPPPLWVCSFRRPSARRNRLRLPRPFF